ncbi:MAG: stage II sporulation protein M [Nanoarchaeota archaeon]|nr:stage II sporulation protein M [Nanoarchaeota archaeon]
MVKRRKKSKKIVNFEDQYVKSWNFIKQSREFIYVAVLIFFIFAVIGFFFQDVVNYFFKSFFSTDLNGNILVFIERLIEKTENMGSSELLRFIFFNNLQTSFLAMVVGVLFAVFPLFAIVTNGYLLGFVSYLSVKAGGILVLWKLLPHGIFELPAVFLAVGLGLRLGLYIFRTNERPFKEIIVECLRVFLFVILPLLIVAAIIEVMLLVSLG